MAVTRGGLTRIVDRLVERGWVDRDRPDSNRREVYVVLTPDPPDGHHVIEHARTTYLRVLQQTLGTHLDRTELDDLARITGKLLKTMADHYPRCQRPAIVEARNLLPGRQPPSGPSTNPRRR